MKYVKRNRMLNWKPAMKDHRVARFEKASVGLPPQVDLHNFCPPVFDQGQMGSCSGNALAAAFQFGTGMPNVSRLFIYWNERAVEGDPHVDAGATTLKDGADSLMKKGVCLESTWDYDNQNLLACPTSSAYGEAYHRKIKGYSALSSLNDMMNCLAQGLPFVFGIPVYDSFLSEDAAATGMIHYPDSSEKLEGGHALLCVGYTMVTDKFIFRNSWGASWGDQGYGYLPFQYMTDLGGDFFALKV